jgi:hypothetical protein
MSLNVMRPAPKRRAFTAAAERKMRADFAKLKKYVKRTPEKSVAIRSCDPMNTSNKEKHEEKMSESGYRWWNSDEAVISTIAEERRFSE